MAYYNMAETEKRIRNGMAVRPCRFIFSFWDASHCIIVIGAEKYYYR